MFSHGLVNIQFTILFLVYLTGEAKFDIRGKIQTKLCDFSGWHMC